MRCWVRFVLVLGLLASPARVGAQGGDELTVQYTNPTGGRAEQARRAVVRHRGGLIGSSVVLAFGLGLVVTGACMEDPECSDDDPGCISSSELVLGTVGFVLTVSGVVGMAVKGAKLARSKHELRELQATHYETPRRVQWDLAFSRLVF